VSSKSPRRGASPPRPLRAPASACDSPWGQDTIRQIKFWLTHLNVAIGVAGLELRYATFIGKDEDYTAACVGGFNYLMCVE